LHFIFTMLLQQHRSEADLKDAPTLHVRRSFDLPHLL